jgi:hypothetical protein
MLSVKKSKAHKQDFLEQRAERFCAPLEMTVVRPGKKRPVRKVAGVTVLAEPILPHSKKEAMQRMLEEMARAGNKHAAGMVFSSMKPAQRRRPVAVGA